MGRFYTGIGNRQTPTVMLPVLERVAEILAKKGYTLRSGGAEGADEAFEKGCLRVGGDKEIYLPWIGFRDKSPKNPGYFFTRDYDYDAYKRAKALAQTFHPAWDNLKDAVKMLHTRNVHQVLGLDALSPSDFVVCYDMGDQSTGTKQALRIAEHAKVPVYNVWKPEEAQALTLFLKKLA